MSEAVSLPELTETMFRMISDAAGVRKLKPADVGQAMIEHFGPERCSKELCEQALQELIDSGRCIYTYFGENYIGIPRPEAEG